MDDGQRRLKLNNEQEIDVCSYTRIHMQLYTHTHTHTLILAYIDTASDVLDYMYADHRQLVNGATIPSMQAGMSLKLFQGGTKPKLFPKNSISQAKFSTLFSHLHLNVQHFTLKQALIILNVLKQSISSLF